MHRAEIVFTVPNDARSEVLNVVGGTIALIERGEVCPRLEWWRHIAWRSTDMNLFQVPFATKVRNAQAVSDMRLPAVGLLVVTARGGCVM